MKRSDVIDLIRYHVDHDDPSFNSKAASIAQEFEAQGSPELCSYIMALISETPAFVPQMESGTSGFLTKIATSSAPLPLPTNIASDIRGIINAIARGIGVNKFLFEGAPGSGKTESAKQIARIVQRELYSVNASSLVESRLGETSKNIIALFNEINQLGSRAVVLFDEIDAIALDRVNANDVREMGRATSTMLGQLDTLSSKVVLIATTNLYSRLDKALARRFDKTINFDRYSEEDLIEVGESIAANYVAVDKFVSSNRRLLKKILSSAPKLPYPGDLENLIKTSIAFSDPNNPTDYLAKLYKSLNPNDDTLATLKAKGFTVREIEILTGLSKSTVARMLKELANE